ncbi:MAG: hypothetical protein AAGA54_20650 [Myxococcota bacterium]
MRYVVLCLPLLAACKSSGAERETTAPEAETTAPASEDGEDSSSADVPATEGAVANVTAVTVSGDAGAYTLSVTLESPDTGCDQYANWWEVLDADGQLLYRRILGHSHVDEQPFTRSGGPVAVEADQPVFVRAHMDPGGYGGVVFTGTAQDGFTAAESAPEIADAVESADPQPTGCAF